MKRWIKIVIGVVMVICLMVGAFYVGGVVGFMTGVFYKTGITVALDGVGTVVILRAIREGRTDSAIKLLETILDTKVIEPLCTPLFWTKRGLIYVTHFSFIVKDHFL